MSNIVYEDKFYNEDRKNKFMNDNEYAEGTRKILSRMFKISQVVESDLGKDLCDFSREELRKLLYLFIPKTAYSSRANAQWISVYIDWCSGEGYLNGLNPLETVSKEWKEQFVVKSIKKYWTKYEIDKIINSRVNAQDAIVLSLLWNGVRGTGNSELLNLTKDDVDSYNNRLHLYDDISQVRRTIPVDEQCIKLCQQALRENQYEKMNGSGSRDLRSLTTNLIENDFIIRASRTRTVFVDEAEKNIIYRRLSNIADEINEPNFNPSNLQASGILHMASEIFKQTGKLEDEELQLICDQFNINAEQSLYRLKSEFLNVKTINELYEES